MKIAIQGHPARGREVIQILENLGGKNDFFLEGNNQDVYYGISAGSSIIVLYNPTKYKFYTLEEFKKEFPFKIGDLCIYHSGFLNTDIVVKILGMIIKNDCIMYEVGYKDITKAHSDIYKRRHTLKLYKEMKEERNITLTIDKAKEWYNKGGELREVALQAYSEKELTKVELPKTWEEFCKKYPIQDHEAFINYANGNITVCKECAGSGLGIWMRKPERDRCKCVSQKSAEAHLAMIQLEQLRDCWRQGWKPDWINAKQDKYCIGYYRGRFKVAVLCETRYFLSFPTIEMAEEFLKCFRDLIEKAGDLI